MDDNNDEGVVGFENNGEEERIEIKATTAAESEGGSTVVEKMLRVDQIRKKNLYFFY